MASIIQVTTDGKPGAPLDTNGVGYDKVTNELYVGSGTGTADGSKLSIEGGELKVTRNNELDIHMESTFAQHGLIPNDGVNEIRPQDMFEEVDVADTLVDKKGYPVRFTDGVYDRLGEELVTNGDFSDGTTGWILEDNSPALVVNSNKQLVMSNQNVIRQDYIPVTAGKTYIIKYNIISNDNRLVSYFRDQNGNTLQDNAWESTLGEKTFVYHIPDGVTSLQFRVLSQANAIIDNISVKEFPQYQLPKAPFATGATDELLDDSINGLTCQTVHSKGDIVVTGNELIATDNITITVDASTLGYYQQPYDFDGTSVYTLHFTIENNSANSVLYNYSTLSNVNLGVLAAGSTHTIDFIGHSSRGIDLRASGSDGDYITLSNISVKLKDQSYIATEDTADMYDYDDNAGTITLSDGDIVKVLGANTNGIINHYYMRNDGGSSSVELAGASFNNTSYYLDLGTATNMSLQNPYFKAIPYVTKQVALLVEKTSAGAILNTVKPLGNMYGEESVLTYEADIFGELGYSQKADRIWTDGSSEFILLGLKGYLNGGAYHPWFNEFGCATFGTDGNLSLRRSWYTDSAFTGKSVYETLANKTTSALGYGDIENGAVDAYGNKARPDSKFYDKTYIEGQGGLICFAIPNAKTPTYKHQEEVKRNLVDGYIENGVELVQVFNETTNVVYAGTANIISIYTQDTSKYHIGEVVNAVYINDGYTQSISGIIYAITNNSFIALNTVVPHTITPLSTNITAGVVCVPDKSPYLATQGTTTHTDIIGDPANYPQDLLNVLASGKGVGFMNSLLADDGGNTLIPNLADYNNTVRVSNRDKLSKKQLSICDIIQNVNDNYYATNYVLNNDGSSSTNGSYRDDQLQMNNNIMLKLPSSFNVVADVSSYYSLLSYQAQNQPAISITTPQPIEVVDRDLIASNHHSVYAYNGLTYGASGKVATGGAVESKGVEDAVEYHDDTTATTLGVVYVGMIVKSVNGYTASSVEGHYYRCLVSIWGTTPHNLNTQETLTNPAEWQDLGLNSLTSTPKHNTLTLDANSIVASKALVTQTANATQVFTQEMVWDYSLDYGGEFVTKTGSDATLTVVNTIYRVISGNHIGYWRCNIGTTVAFDDQWWNAYDDKLLSDAGDVYYTKWNGTGFGDSNQFDQLTSGTDTDLNGNTINTKVLLKPSSIKLGD